MKGRPLLCLLMALAAWGLPAQSHGNEATTLYRQGREAQGAADYPRAIDLYRASLRVNPDYSQPLAGLAESFFQLEEYEEALRYVSSARRYEQGSLELAVLEGRIRLGLGELEQARALFNRVLAEEKNNLEAKLALAELDIAAGQRAGAEAKLREILRARPDSREAMLRLAWLNDEGGDRGGAQHLLELALRSDSSDPGVRSAAASFALRQGDAALAAKHLQAALAVRPDHVPASLLLAQSYIQLGNPAAAVEVAREVVKPERHRSDPQAWYVLGLAYEKAGSVAEAQSSFEAAVRLDPDDELARIALENLALQKIPDKDEARRKYAAPHLERGRRFEGRNLLDKALTEYRRCLLLDPGSREGRLEFAEVHRTLGFPGKYRQELEVLRDRGYKDNVILDGLEITASQLEDSVSAQWGLNQYGLELELERRKYRFAVYFTAAGVREIHPFAGPHLTAYLKDQLRRFDTVEVTEDSPEAASFEDAFRRARGTGSDYFLLLGFEESERSFAAQLEQYLTRTGTKVATYRAFRTGNDRIQDCSLLLTAALRAQLPPWGRLVTRQFDRGVIDLGSQDGIRGGAELVVVKKGRIRLSNDRVGLAASDADIVGGLRIDRLDERVAEGVLSRRSFFDLVNPGDEVIFAAGQTTAAPEPAPPAAQSLLRRLYRLLGF